MVEQLESLWTLISMLLLFFQALRKALSMALCSGASAPPPSPLSWKRLGESPILVSKKARDVSRGLKREAGLNSDVVEKVEGFNPEEVNECLPVKAAAPTIRKLWKRPSRIAIPPSSGSDSGEAIGEAFFRKEDSWREEKELQGSGYCLASKRGTRHMMEDGHGVITNINGDSKQAFFGVFDGHGGRAAVDFVSEKLGKNIISAVEEVNRKTKESTVEMAIRSAYLTTDCEFLNKGLSSGACAATVFMKSGELHVSNVGDCRVVMSRKGVADVLTSDHIAGREDERIRIENLGGYVSCHNGVWRVQDSLAISRAMGDVSMKEWIISEPETRSIPLACDCEFLVLATDGLWDKVSNQEAVDVVKKQRNSLQACKELVEISCGRGNRDDITVMVVELRGFCSGG